MSEKTVSFDSVITAVTIYPDRARITRSGSLDLKAGVYRLAADELPACLDPASVRAAARGTARARLLGVDVQKQFFSETPVERVRELEEKVESLGDELRGMEAQAGLLKLEYEALGDLATQNRVFARGLANGQTSPEAHLALLDSLRSRGESVNADLLDLELRQRQGKRRLQQLQNELGQLRGAKDRERYTALVELEIVESGQLTVVLNYVVSRARWQPLYDIRLLEEDGDEHLEIGYLGQLVQSTGEDWTDVTLSLSTARPALSQVLPELDPWYVGPHYPVPVPAARLESMSVKRAAVPGADMLASVAPEMEMAKPPPVEREVEELVADVQVSGAAVSYQVPTPLSIPADGAPHKVAVARFQLPPELDYTAAPKLMETAYRRAIVKNHSPYTLLPGKANLFAGDEFIGVTSLELVAPEGEIELYLGADDRIKVQRELKRRQVDKRIMGNRRRLNYAYQITVENLLPVEARVIVHDQLPISRHEEIKVKVGEISPPPTGKDDLNLLEWELTLPAGAKVEIQFSFTVEHPQDMPVVGLP